MYLYLCIYMLYNPLCLCYYIHYRKLIQKKDYIMSHFLESMMLVCFGLSWPLNVYKNLKAGSTKGMSLRFTLLIIAGYICGITAKMVNGDIKAHPIVFAVYVLNLFIVSINVIVYFRNKKLDMKRLGLKDNGKIKKQLETLKESLESEINRKQEIIEELERSIDALEVRGSPIDLRDDLTRHNREMTDLLKRHNKVIKSLKDIG